MAVVDATVLVEYLVDAAQAELAREQLTRHRYRLWAPHLIDAEVGHALRRHVRHGGLEAADAEHALDELIAMELERVDHAALLPRAWELRDNLSFYDALYVALAEAIGQPLLTFDARIAGASGVRAEIEVLAQAA
jgi:predicted nucleic acid-binding protein